MCSSDLNKNNIEVILINDGSTDDSIFIAQDYFEKYINVKLINQENQGLAGARNIGIENAKGDYVWFVDSDDYIEENCLKNIIKILKNDLPDIMHFRMFLGADRNKNHKSTTNYNLQDGKVYTSEELFKTGFLPTSACSALYKRDFLLKNNLRFNTKAYREDVEFTGRSYMLAESILYYNKPLYYYYEREGSITTEKTLENKIKLFNAEITIAESFREYLNSNKTDNKYLNNIMSERINLVGMNLIV